ncbi:pantothenate kinase [Aliifodinibius salipaludis]|uniref:Type III pantothenate kinase n=1 Tax=Fodinibius salipaludis TaxID=2032627 RepID=A0A2A2GF14_9BACT|nr:type III pantothenate kinase [Aliifodinibius salipaludis]PAU95352.1 pantothenate kinase [Aliifodinibius salipaludis]
MKLVMLLALDIGNSNIVIGASENGSWGHQWRIQTDTDKTADEYVVMFNSLFSEEGLAFSRFDQIIISSVVPQLTQTISKMFEKKSRTEALILNGEVDTGLAIKRVNRKSVGADLIADAVGAYAVFEDDCIVVDFGTATTVMVVQNPGELIGGSICAGLKVTIDALVGKTAQLSQIPLEPPENVIGSGTMEAMQSGLVLGHLCMIEGLIDRMQKQLGGSAKVIATGGLSEKIAEHTDYFDVIDPMLTLDGLRLIMERQQN